MQKIFLLLGTLLLLPVFSGELVDGKFKDWKKNSPLCVKESSGIAISGQMGKDIRWHFTPQKDFSTGGILMIKALVSKENIVSGKPGFRWAAPVLNVVDVSGEKRKVLFAHSFGLDSVKDQEFAKSLKIAPGTKRLEISLLMRNCTGRISFRNVSAVFTASKNQTGANASGDKELVVAALSNWKRSGSVCTVEANNSIAINAPDTKKDLFWALTPAEDFTKGGVVRISCNVVTDNIVSGRPDYRWAAPVLTVVAIGKDGKRKALIARSFGTGSNAGQKYSNDIPIPVGTKTLRIAFNLRNCSGKVTFRNLSIKLLKARSDEKIFLKSFIHPKGVYLTKVDRFPRPDHPQPQLPGNERFALFRIDIPRQTFDANPPAQEQLTGKFSAFSVPGEKGNLFIGCYAKDALKGMNVKVHDLEDGKGNRIAGSQIRVRRAFNWPQSGDRGLRLSYYVVPELLLDLKKCPDLPANTSAMYMIDVRVPENCVPGIYRGKLTFSSANAGEKTAEVAFRVFPVKLQKPDPEKFVTIAHIGAYGARKDKMVELCKELKSRGFEGILIACHYGRGRLELERRNGRLAIRSFDRLDHAVAGYLSAGMTGVFVIHLSDQLEVAVARAMGIPKDRIPSGLESTKFIPGMETEEFKKVQIEALGLIRERCKGIKNVIVMGLDEPYGQRIPRAKWEMELIRKAGFKVGFYGDEKTWFPLQPDFMISASRFHSAEFKQVKEDCERKNARFLQYGGSGSYGYAYGGLMPSRATHGWGAYLNGVSGYTAWTFFALRPLDMKKRSYLDTWATVIQLDTDYTLLYTLQYEGIAEGITDYAWLYTLDQTLKRNASKPAAAKIRKYFTELKKEMRRRLSDRLTAEPSVSPEDTPPELLNYEADELRLLLISWIMELEK